MKTKRIIIGCIFAAIAIAVNYGVFNAWIADGGCIGTIIMAFAFYTSTLAAVWYTIDSTIKEANK